MTSEPSLSERKARILETLRDGRAVVTAALEDARLDEIYSASQWGVVDAVNHMVTGLPYYDMMQRTLREDRPQFPAWPTAEESWTALKARMVRSIDEAIAFVEGLDETQLARVALCGADEVPVIQFLEWASGHYLEHGKQIRDEILPLVRRTSA